MLSPKKEKALQALLQYSTQKAAAKAAGINPATLRRYFTDPEFVQAYKDAYADIVNGATKAMQGTLLLSISSLRDVLNNETESAQTRVNAARTILEYTLKYTEFNDILQELEAGE